MIMQAFWLGMDLLSVLNIFLHLLSKSFSFNTLDLDLKITVQSFHGGIFMQFYRIVQVAHF